MSWRRREFLRLGAAGALAWAGSGCPRPVPPPRRIEGKIWGQDAALGHLLRGGTLRGRAPAATERVETLIVGGGVAGLSCAWRLRREGLDDVLLLEAGDQVGGNARAGENSVSPYPWGAHYLRAPTREHRALETFLDEVGLIRGRDAAGRIDWDLRAVGAAPLERLFEAGLWRLGLFPPPFSGSEADEAELRRFEARVAELGAERDAQGRRAFALPVVASSRDPRHLALDRITLAEWLEREGFRGEALRWYAEYACRDDYGCTLETTSAWAGLHYFAARLDEDPSREVLFAWPEGNAHLVRLLQAAHGPPRTITRALCFRIEPGARPGEPSAALVYHPADERVVRYEARHLVFAGPQFVLARLLPGAPRAASPFSYSPWLVANVTLDEAPGGYGAPLAWDNVLYGKPSLGYVVANREAPADAPCVLTWYFPFSGPDPRAERTRLLELDHAGITAMVLEELGEAHPELLGRVRRVDAWRWGHAMIRPVPGFLWGGARETAARRRDALLCAHSDLSGLSLFEEALYQGVRAGEQILQRAGRPFQSIL